MKFLTQRFVFSLAVLLAVVTILSNGCATMPREADMKESLRGTAERYWKLRMEEKYEDTYGMEDKDGLPAFSDYPGRARRIKSFQVLSYSIESIAVEGNKGNLTVRFSFILPQISKPVADAINDEWIFKDGEWWHKFPPK